MKRLSAVSILLLVCSLSYTLKAQTADSWVSVPLADEGFIIEMPKSHEVKTLEFSFEQFKVDGRVYTATDDGVEYIVWSFVNEGPVSSGPLDIGAYLDASADLVWESLLKPRRDKFLKSLELRSYMSYAGELSTPLPGREYTITLGNRPGVTHFYIAGRQIYVLTILNADPNSTATHRFLSSFGLNIPGLPVAAIIKDPILPPSAGVGTGVGTGGGIGPGRGGNVGGGDRNVGGPGPSSGTGETDYNRVFAGKDVTQKARILSKAEPSYTESARKYSVTGTVVLRAVFSSSGQVSQIRAVRGLPHGLTLRAIVAARNIKFIPAQKDGHVVSMWFQLEYNFSLY